MTIYVEVEQIGAYLGATLTTAQQAQAEEMAANASDFIERALGRSWLGYSAGAAIAVANERHVVRSCRAWLEHAPVAAISSVGVRLLHAGATTYSLTADYQYELLDERVGEVVFSPTYEGQRVEIDYTSTEPTPPIVTQFATELAAGMLALSMAGSGAAVAAASGVKRYTLWGGDLSVEYATPPSQAQSGNTASSSTRLPVLWEQIEAMFSRKVSVA